MLAGTLHSMSIVAELEKPNTEFHNDCVLF